MLSCSYIFFSDINSKSSANINIGRMTFNYSSTFSNCIPNFWIYNFFPKSYSKVEYNNGDNRYICLTPIFASKALLKFRFIFNFRYLVLYI